MDILKTQWIIFTKQGHSNQSFYKLIEEKKEKDFFYTNNGSFKPEITGLVMIDLVTFF